MKTGAQSKRSRSRSGRSKASREQVLAKRVEILKSSPGIRPSELDRRLRVTQSDALRAALIGGGLVRKIKDGRETHLYAK
jgi:hypothetical protein